MNSDRSLPSSQREFERGFAWTLLLSAVAHAVIIAALVLAPGFVLRPQSQLKSYTVELVDASKLGGTNLIAGSKGKAPEPPKVEPAKAKPAEPEPPPAKVEPPPEPPKPEAKAPEPPPKPEAKPPEAPKADEKAVAIDKKAEATPTRPQEVARVEVPTVAKAPPTLAAKVEPTVRKVEPTLPKPTVAKAQATATMQPKAVAKPQVTPTKGQPQAVANVPATPASKPNATAAKAGATAGQAKGTPPADKAVGEAKARDDRIAAAIKRVEQQSGTRGGGSGSGPDTAAPGGPIALGPGEGAGGEVRSLATIMYTNRIQAMIKEKWAWAGAKSLKADIGFTILPSGAVANVRTVASSGDATYDKLAETAVRAASPFPAPPDECAEEFETGGFLYTFEPE